MFESISERFQKIFRDLRGMGKITEKNIEDPLREIRKALLEADVNYKIAKNFIEAVKEKSLGQEVLQSITPGQQVVKIVHDEMVKLLESEKGELSLSANFESIMILGLQGSGKTTTAGKLARYFLEKGISVLLAAADTKRLAARDQLKMIAQKTGAEYFSIDNEESPVVIAQAAKAEAQRKGVSRLIVDTAGRLHVDSELMQELKDVERVLQPAEALFVADATTGQDAVNICREFSSSISLTGIILTKMDGDARGGAVMSITQTTGKSVKFVGIGERPEDFEPFYPDRMASRILGMGDIVSLVEKAQQAIDEKTAKKMEEKFRKAEFDLNDFLESIRQIRKMGPLEGLMKMLPGMSQMKGISFDEREILHVEAMISSMTLKERMNPDILDGSRRKRISAGAGRPVQELNALLKRYGMMRKMMKQVGKMGKGFPMPSTGKFFL